MSAKVKADGPSPSRPTMRRVPLGDDSEGTGKKKKGFFRKLLKITAILAAIGAVLTFWKRKQGSGLDDVEWQELPPPAGG